MSTAPSLVLRPAAPGDAAALADLGARAFCAKFAHLYRPEDLEAYLAGAHTEPVVAAEIADPALPIMLAEAGGALVGFCKLRMACGWPDEARGASVIELKQLYTAPDATGRGIGAALTDWALATARQAGADEIQLSVWSGNADAQRFYRRHGFAQVGETFFMVGQQRDEEFLYARMV